MTQEAQRLWRSRTMSLRDPRDTEIPEKPGRPERPVLVPAKQVKKRSLTLRRGRIALLHALAHIELNAIDLALDIIARFATENVPRSFFDSLAYGDLPAHNGLWEAAHETRQALHARLAIVPLVLESRGLNVTLPMVTQLEDANDMESANILRIIYEDEKSSCCGWCKMVPFPLPPVG